MELMFNIEWKDSENVAFLVNIDSNDTSNDAIIV
jgi:hypothetical protein